MKRIYFSFFVTMAMLMLSVSSAWAQYVKLTAEDGTESWIEIEGIINGTNIEIYKGDWERAIDINTKGSIDLNEVWSRSGGRGTHYQVTNIGKGAFWYCSGLTSITIPSSVTSIGGSAFSYCYGLTSITIPSSVTSIGGSAFSYCYGLTSITIPSSVTSIGGSAFRECYGLTSIIIPSSVTSIGEYAFLHCSGLTSIVVESGNAVYDSRNNCNAIIETASNTLIAGCKNTIIPSSVTSIGEYAFNQCSGLTSITIPNGVESIDECAFSNCSDLTSVTIASSVISIGSYVFSDCSGLTSVTIGNSVASIGYWAFYGCSGLTSVTIPSSVISIGEYAFVNCSGLTSIVVEPGNSKYDSRNNCNAIIEKTSNTLVAGCKNTKIPNSVTSIGDYVFYGCSDLTSIVIPSSVTSIGNQAFSRCSGLTSVVIPSSVTSIGNWAFSRCSGLTSIEIPSSVTTIGSGAFAWCSGLTFVSIPSSVTNIGEAAFGWCSGLTSVTSYIINIFETGANAFSGCDNAILYVPKGLVDNYKSTSDWNSISTIEEMIYKIPLTLACNNKGKVLVNGDIEFSNDVDHVDVIDGKENSFEFIPNENCKLEQVIIDGFDVMSSVKDNKLTAKIRENSKMIVTFSKQGDMNSDGRVDISDVVALVNMILGQ